MLSGDATDADGCIELAQIAKSGADILYIMHLSQPFSVPSDVVTFEAVIEDVNKLNIPLLDNRVNLKECGKEFNKRVLSNEFSYNFGTVSKAKDLIKRSQHAFRKVFEESRGSNATKFFFRYSSKDGHYYFNKRNPFGFIWKSEMKTFNENFEEPSQPLKISDRLPNLDDYTEVILDLSGSSAFWGVDKELRNFLLEAQNLNLLKYVVLMGSVETSEPKTLVLPELMIRHPLATMNQLYDPESFSDIASQLQDGPRWVVVSNNIVNRVADYTKTKKKTDFIAFIVEKVVKSTRKASPMLVKVIESFYSDQETYKWKLYDCLTGKIIYDHVKGKAELSSINPDYKLDGKRVSNSLFTEPTFGATIVGPQSVLHEHLNTTESVQGLISGGNILDDVIVPYFTKDWFVEQKREKKTLVVVSGGAHDASKVIELAQIAKSGADVLYLLHLSQPFGVKKGVEFEKVVQEVEKKVGGENGPLSNKSRLFNKKVRHELDDESVSYEYRTSKKAEVVIRRCQQVYRKVFDENKQLDYQLRKSPKMFFRYEAANNTKPSPSKKSSKKVQSKSGAFFINKKNPFGLKWKSESEVFDESFNDPAQELKVSDALPELDEYTEVILNLSGSCAFWNIDAQVRNFLLEAQKRGLLQYVVVTGGMETARPAPTHDRDLVTRHPYATVSHVWDPESFADITVQLSKQVRWVVVTNAAAGNAADYSHMPSKADFVSFVLGEVVKSTKEASPMLVKVLEKFYSESSRSEWQLLDCLAAKTIYDHVKERAALSTINSKRLEGTRSMSRDLDHATATACLLTEAKYGVTMVGPQSDLELFFKSKQISCEEKNAVHEVIVPYFTKDWYVETKKKTLVVVSGGATDGDGFIELAQIAKSGADVLFVMHVSQPFGVRSGVQFETAAAEARKAGSDAGRVFNERVRFNRGDDSYRYGTEKKAEDLLKRCHHAFRTIFDQSKIANMAKNSSKFVFRSRNGQRMCYFNKRNPFGLIWKSETDTFNESFDFSDLESVSDSEPLPDLDDYEQIILDISGSSAFWGVDEELKGFLLKAQEKRLLKYVVVMGSIETSVEPKLFSDDNMIARHSMATITQAFDPDSFAKIASELCDARWIVVPNNVGRRVADYSALPTKERLISFIVGKILLSSRQDSPMLVRVIEAFYSEQEKFNWKLFNCLSGKIIYDHVKGKAELSNLMADNTTFEKLELFTEPTHGVTIVGPQSVLHKYLTDTANISQAKKVRVQDVIVPPFSMNEDDAWYLEKFHPYSSVAHHNDSKLKQHYQEFLFPVSYLVDKVVERERDATANCSRNFYGVKNDQLVSPNTMVQRMMLITAKALKFEFGFAKNLGIDKDFKHLASFKLINESEVVSNIEPGALTDKLEVELDPAFPYFNSIRIQCLISKRRNQRHICYIEVSATNAKARHIEVSATDSEAKVSTTEWSTGSKWSIGKELKQFEDLAGKVCVYTPEIIHGPLVFTGVGVDLFAGFLFQISSLVEKPSPSSLRRKTSMWLEETFYDEKARLSSAGITDYMFFESPKGDQTGYREMFQLGGAVRKEFRELAVEDKEAPILFQRLNRSYLELTSNPISIVLPSMIQLLEKSLAESKIGLIQSVIRINHMEAKYTNYTVRKIWSTFTKSITLVKKFVLLRSELNVFECAILLDCFWKKIIALSVAAAQILSYAALASYIYYDQCTEDSAGAARYHCFGRVKMAIPISLLSTFLTFLKVRYQTTRQFKFETIFKDIIKPSSLNYILLLVDFISNVLMGFFSMVLCFVLICRSDNVLDVVLNALAVASISELDEELGSVLDDGGNLVEEFFKAHLKESMAAVSREIDRDLAASGRMLDSSFLLGMLVRANYSPNQYADGEDVTDRVRVFIENGGNRFMVTDDNLGSQRAQERTEYLVLHFKYGISFSLKEQTVVYFSEIEHILKSHC